MTYPARACAVLLLLTACSSATSPSAGLPGPQGTLLTTVVHGTPWRVGDTTKVDLVITDTSSTTAVFELLEPVPTLEIFDASGDSIPVTYLGPPNFLSLSVGSGATVVTSAILGVGGTPGGTTITANLTPGTYTVAACLVGGPGDCGQPVSVTVVQ